MNEAEYHAARGKLKELEAKADQSEAEREHIDTLRKEVEAFEAGERSKGKPDQE